MDDDDVDKPILIPPELGLQRLRELRQSGLLPPESEGMCDFMQLADTIFLDLVFIRKAFEVSDSPWEQRVFGRHLCLVLYESLEDIPQALTRAVRMRPCNLDAGGVNYLALLRNELKILRRKYESGLKVVRDAAAAHRELDVLKLYSVIDALDLDKLREITVEIQGWIARCSMAAFIAISPMVGISRSIVDQVDQHLRRVSES